MPPGRLRPAGAEEAPARAEDAPARPRRRRDRDGLAVLDVAALRLRRELHVRGRHAAGGAACAGAVARPRPAEGAARPGGAARPDRPGRARGGRGAAAGEPRSPDQLHDVLRLRGDLRPGQYDPALAEPLLAERRAITARIGGEERLVAAEDAGRYRDALGVMPPGGLPEAFLEADEDALESLVARFAKGRGPFTTAEANDHFVIDVEPVLRALEREERLVRGELRPGGSGARVVRSGRPAAAAPRVAGRAAQGGRAGRAGDAGPLPAELARDRPPREPPRGARAAPGACAAGLAVGERRPAAPRPELPACVGSTSSARPASSSGSAPASTGSAVYFREDAPALGRVAAAERPEGEVHDRIRGVLGQRRRVLVRPARRGRAGGRAGAACAVGPRLGGRGHERRLDAASSRAALRRPAAGASSSAILPAPLDRDHGHAGPLVAHRPALPGPPRIGARSPSCCSSGRESSRATAFAPRGSRAATARSTGS